MKAWVPLAVLSVAVTTAACSQERSDEVRRDVDQTATSLEEAAREGAAADAARAAAAAADAAAEEVEEQGIAGSARAVSEGAEERVEHSADLAEKTYGKSREKEEGVVESAGDSYEAVLEAGEKKPPGDTPSP